jgi:iron complex transport system ATP-binding protein
VLLDAADVTFGYRATPRRPPEAGADGLVIRGVSLSVPRGGFLGLLGPNGSGKTTLLKLIGGSIAPTSGAVRLDGRPVSAIARRELARRLAVVPQETHLAFDYTVLEIVLMGRYPHLGAFAFEGPADLSAAREALATTGTADLADRAFATLSGGEKQRVIIASALAQLDARAGSGTRPDGLLLLDEPTASLDLRYQLEVASLLTRLNAEHGIAVVLSTHDLRLARALCSRLALLSAGRVLAEGTPSEVLTPALVGQLYGIGAELAAPVLA